MITDWVIGLLTCPACIRFRFSPVHWYLRLAGFCDGRSAWI